jgi:hypothetical protein
MRLHSIIIAGLVLAPGTALAAEATPASPPVAAAPQSPAPQPEAPPNGYRSLAIAAGVVVGVVVVEYLTAGAATPMVAAAVPVAADPVAAAAAAPAVEPVAAAATPVAATVRNGFTLAEGLTIAAGAVVGGYVGGWLYNKQAASP